MKKSKYKIIHVLKRMNNAIGDDWNARELERIKELLLTPPTKE